MTIHVGDLRSYAVFRSPNVATDDGDTTLEPFVDDFHAWVQIQPVGGGEVDVGDQNQAFRTHLVTMRYDARLRERMQMVARGRKFEILSALNVDERDIELQLQCRELV